jgi:diadenosine tetraphosphate (Ap4A) HIT family hydrolase
VSCIFCDISAGEAKASFVYEDERTIAFLDIAPLNAGHTLVVPRAHAASLEELEPDDVQHVVRVAQRVAIALRRTGFRVDGVNLWLADGAAAGQDVFHAHMHVVPRFDGDGFVVSLPPGRHRPDRDELDANAAELRSAL